MRTIFKIQWTHLAAEANQLAELRAVRVALAGRMRTVRVAHGMLSICWSFKLKDTLGSRGYFFLMDTDGSRRSPFFGKTLNRKATWIFFSITCFLILLRGPRIKLQANSNKSFYSFKRSFNILQAKAKSWVQHVKADGKSHTRRLLK